MYTPEISEPLHSNLIEYSEDINKAPPLFICYDINNKLPIQLELINYIIDVQPGMARIEMQQTYRTQNQQIPIQLEYMFIIDKQSVVRKIVAELEEEKVLGIVKELGSKIRIQIQRKALTRRNNDIKLTGQINN
ncbi:unnamed protein product [Paramecium sonneborni]|uniref:VIT domain-containing protein n=1 Tax=Paramecium sonneborni TaxID=65129 RepID=A0A8S1RNW0_9CILI|nr:unnamed protein product [Paramecium sonneborni]